MSLLVETVNDVGHGVVDVGMLFNFLNEGVFLLVGGQFAVQKKVTGLKVVGVLSQLLNGIAAVQ